MYNYISDVEILINEMIETIEIDAKSEAFYRGRIKNFFDEYMNSGSNINKPINAINYFDVQTYLDSLGDKESEQGNHYYALKRFFEYTYKKGKTEEIISKVIKPIKQKNPIIVLNDEQYLKIKQFIFEKSNKLKDRLILALFNFTGLSRKYIANLKNNQIAFKNGEYRLILWKSNKEYEIPLKSELQLIIHEYISSITDINNFQNVFEIGENEVSTYVGKLTTKIIGKKIKPTTFSNTFIAKSLSNGNYLYEVSRLTLESVTTIEQHVLLDDDLINKQKSILNSF